MNKPNHQIVSQFIPLLKNQNFKEIEKLISLLSSKEKEKPFFLNLLGVAKIQNNSSSVEEALTLFEEAFKKDNSLTDALYNLCSYSLKKLKFKKSILKLLNNHLEKVEFDFKAITFLARIHFELGNIDDSIEFYKKTIGKKETTDTHWVNTIFISNYSSDYSEKGYEKLCKQYLKTLKKIGKTELVEIKIKKNKRKRIGFFSTNLNQHSITNFLIDTVKHLNLSGYETIAFNATRLSSEDNKTKELKGIFSNWVDVRDLQDLEVINLIRNHSIDILFDLVGYTYGSRMNIFKNRSAPLQISWIGNTNTTNLKEMDYIITDPYVIDTDQNFTEKFLKMPDIWSCHTLIKEKIDVVELPALKNDYITFGSFNTFSKISDETITVWSEILKKTNSKLILKSSIKRYDKANEILLDKFESTGVNLNNIKFLERSNTKTEHLKCYNQIDISLDTFPYNGATTSFEAIWMGVPVLTLCGKTFHSRYGFSINKNLDMTNFIAKNKKDYVKKAIKLSLKSNYHKLTEIRKSLRQKAIKSPLFNNKLFSKNFIKKLSQIPN
ncbi:hypothetical protein N8Z31_02495 [Pelagibacteraceae bacterium]|jgi:predicted O-linked N-acetylglucosamine transferase (SPINDLY family)|nr:hypothetical protein [Pelagibacteraceae bacterium]